MSDLGLYEIDNIYCGECVDMMGKLPDNCIDLTVTSPPYDLVDEDMITHPGNGLRDYNGYDWDFVSVAKELWRVTKLGGVVVWVVGDATVEGSETGTSFRQALYFKELGFKLHDTMIYQKISAFPENNRYRQNFEFMFVFSKGHLSIFNPLQVKSKKPGEKRYTERQKNGKLQYPKNQRLSSTMRDKFNIWDFEVASNGIDRNFKEAPAQFPEALARDHIISWSNPNALILDPFMGSGTTAKMAIEQDRHYLGFDISQEYVDLANKRTRGARIPLPGMNL